MGCCKLGRINEPLSSYTVRNDPVFHLALQPVLLTVELLQLWPME